MILKGARKSFEAVTEANRGKKVYKRAAIGLFGLLIVSLLAIFGVSFAAGMILKDSKLEESFEGTAVMKATDGTPVSVSVTEEAKALFDMPTMTMDELVHLAVFFAYADMRADASVGVWVGVGSRDEGRTVAGAAHFLEHLLQRRYLESVPSIVPVLEHEHRTADSKLNETLMELGALDAQRLKERGRAFRERFLARLQQVVRGTADVSSETFGETLADEHVRGGVFVGSTERPLRTQKALLDRQVPSAKMRLFGGAQYHRAIGEFRAIVGSMECPMPTSEEIANACGVDDMHDGVNYVRTACVLAVGKARQIFEPFLYELGYRLSHVQRRMLPVVLHMLKRDNAFLSGHDAFLQRVGAAYHNFIDETEIKCRERCMEDLQSTTRFVTWSVHSHSGRGLKDFLAEALGGVRYTFSQATH